MKRVKNKNMMILVVIFVVTLTSSIGYSALQSNLKVTADLNVLKDYIPDGTLYDMMHHISEMDNTNSKYVSSTKGIDFSQVSSNTNGKGVYELYTTATDKYPIHYYRGDVNNNVIFANFCWKIIRTTETGGVKLIYNGEASDDGKCDNTGADTSIETSAYNESYDNAKYVGYKYDNDEADSTIKAKIDSWYKDNIEENYSTYLEDTVFCNDRSSRTSENNTYYGAYDRNYYNENRTPSLECSQDSDKFTVSNGKLTYPVGLITNDETVYAGGLVATSNNTYYLYNNQNYWTMSPSYFSGSNAFVWGVYSTGNLINGHGVNSNYGVRPVLSLKQGTKYLSGNGTKDTPFLITPLIPSKPIYEIMKTNSVLDNIKSEYVESETGINFSNKSSDKNGKGIYELHTTSSDEHPIYYYRGVVDNNIIFADFCWKIIRTTETGGVKLLYNGYPTSDNKCTNTTADDLQSPRVKFYDNSNEAKFVGYKYDDDTEDSKEEAEIDAWYKEHIDEKEDKNGKSYTTYLEDITFCNDRSIASKSGFTINYGAYNRLYENRTPSLECPQDDDKFTVANGKLTYPVGLITIDEVAYAGGAYNKINRDYYLYVNSGLYWTMTPFYFNGSDAVVWIVDNYGTLYFLRVANLAIDVRPVVSLMPNTKVKGKGTSDKPYIVK